MTPQDASKGDARITLLVEQIDEEWQAFSFALSLYWIILPGFRDMHYRAGATPSST